jgi:hypothetical protein
MLKRRIQGGKYLDQMCVIFKRGMSSLGSSWFYPVLFYHIR